MQTKIFVTGLQVYGYHGLFEAERELGQKFTLDITCELVPSTSHDDDHLHASVRYDEIVTDAARMATETKFRTLEALSEAIARALLRRFASITHITVGVAKVSPPIAQLVRQVGVEIRLNRKEFSGT